MQMYPFFHTACEQLTLKIAVVHAHTDAGTGRMHRRTRRAHKPSPQGIRCEDGMLELGPSIIAHIIGNWQLSKLAIFAADEVISTLQSERAYIPRLRVAVDLK
jgi:hypothetical protein